MKTDTIIKTTALILALITASITAAAAISCDCGDICVNETGWWSDRGAFHVNATPIQAAVDNAAADEVIYVWNGNYVENIYIATAHLTLAGEGANVVTVTADSDDHIFEVTANYVNISGFNVTGATKSDGIYLNRADHCNISDNTASNNDNCGIYLYSSSDNRLLNNAASNNDHHGIELYKSSNNTLADNTANSNYDGIHLDSSSNNTLTGNTANSNYGGGIYLELSSNNILRSNTASNNDYGDDDYDYYGIEMYDSSDNNLIYNNYLDNVYNAYDDGSNQWDSGSAGNYYSDYNGTDNNKDGIGDDPHPIPGGTSTDRFPLMQPWSDMPQKGDLNDDGIITPADAAIALRLVATGAHDDAADVSGDGQVTSLDALMILQAAAEMVEL